MSHGIVVEKSNPLVIFESVSTNAKKGGSNVAQKVCMCTS